MQPYSGTPGSYGVYARLQNVTLLIKALTSVSIGRDTWATLMFTPMALVLHASGDDQSSTAGGSVPNELFSEYRLFSIGGSPQAPSGSGLFASSDGALDGGHMQVCQFTVHVRSLIDALTLSSGACTGVAPTALTYPASDGRLLVEQAEPASAGVAGGAKRSQCSLVTRPIRDRVLDLHFQDALISNRLSLRGDVARNVLSDLIAFQCEQVRLRFHANGDSVIEGINSPYGSCTFTLPKGMDGVLGAVSGDPAVEGRYLLAHFALAVLGGAGGSGKSVRSGGGFGLGGTAAAPGGKGGAEAVPVADVIAFSRLTFNINTERQLCVMHRARDHDVQVRVDVVISPVSLMLDDIL